MSRDTKRLLWRLAAVALIFTAAYLTGLRWDLTQDRRFTLGKASARLLEHVKGPMQVEILLSDAVPSGFKRLKKQAERLLRSMRAQNPNIRLVKTARSAAKKSAETIASLKALGVRPTRLQVVRSGEQLDKLIFPWIIMTYGHKSTAIPMLNAQRGVSPEAQLNAAAQALEYKLSNAIRQCTLKTKPRVAFYRAEGEDSGLRVAAAKKMLQSFYRVDDFDFRDTSDIQSRFDTLLKYRALLINNPKTAFSEASKYLIDQYIQHGGRVLWAVSPVAAPMDSLRVSGKALAYIRDLNLTDLLFQYGVRIRPVLVKDLQAAPIKLAIGKTGNRTNFRDFLWPYTPLVFPQSTHPIVRNINAVRFEFPSALDTLASPGVKKIPLLWSSPYTALQSLPTYIDLNSLRQPPKRQYYRAGSRVLAMLLEGRFTAAYKNRVKPLPQLPFQGRSKHNKMLLFASGAIFENQTQGRRPLPLGYDKWTDQSYGNGTLLLNSMLWLTDDSGLIGLRSKHLKTRPLNRDEVLRHRSRWQLINLGVPLLSLLAISLLYGLYRREKFGRPAT